MYQEKLSKRLVSLAESQTFAMNAKSQELQAQGVDVVNLSVDEPDFFTPDHVKEAVKSAVDNTVILAMGDGRRAAATMNEKLKN